MSPYLREVRTASGAVAVQVVTKEHGVRRIVEHLGSAHNEVELAALVRLGHSRLAQGQRAFDIGQVCGATSQDAVEAFAITSKRSKWLAETITNAWEDLGLARAVNYDQAFFQLVAARLIQPSSLNEAPTVLSEVGWPGACHRNTLQNALARCVERDYRSALACAALEHCLACVDVSLVFYDLTTLYFQAEKEDALRKVGYSKERRVDPQILVGLLVDRNGFPLEVSCWEGNKAETHTLIPTIEAFKQRAGAENLVAVTDAGTLSRSNLQALNEAGYGSIVGARQTKAPLDLQAYFFWQGDYFTDGHVIDTITPRHAGRQEHDQRVKDEPAWHPHTHLGSWRAIWVYSRKRAARDNKTLALQENRARAIVAGERATRSARFVNTSPSGRGVDEKSLARARRLAGLKGYSTNIPARTMSAAEVVADYHDLWKLEQSFRMSKHDPRRPPDLPPHPPGH